MQPRDVGEANNTLLGIIPELESEKILSFKMIQHYFPTSSVNREVLLEIATAAGGRWKCGRQLIIEFRKVGFHKVYSILSNTTLLTFLIK